MEGEDSSQSYKCPAKFSGFTVSQVEFWLLYAQDLIADKPVTLVATWEGMTAPHVKEDSSAREGRCLPCRPEELSRIPGIHHGKREQSCGKPVHACTHTS